MTDIFISYSRDDQAKVLPIAELLKSMGWSVFMDVRIQTGERWDQVIETNLKAAKCVLVVWSPISVERHWAREEANWGRNKNILVPVSIEGAEPPIGFTLFQVQDLDSWSGDPADAAFQHVLSGITRLAGEPTKHTTAQSADPASSEQTTDFYIQRGNDHLEQGEYDEAIEEYSRALYIDLKCAEAYFKRGYTYQVQGEYDKAIPEYNEAIRLDPLSTLARNNRGNAFRKNGDFDDAIFDYDEAIRIDPQFAAAYRNRGSAYSKKGEYDKAIADYRKALSIDPDLEQAKTDLKVLGIDV